MLTELQKEKKRQWYHEHRESILKQKRDQYHADPRIKEEQRLRRRVWLSKPENRKKHCAYQRIYNRHESKESHADRALKYKYGISLADKQKLRELQNNRCALCEKEFSDNKKHCHVDHNHITGQLRDLLCMKCNLLIGHTKEDPIFIRKIADYIENNGWFSGKYLGRVEVKG